MSLGQVPEAIGGGENLPVSLMDQIGKATTRLQEIADEMAEAKDSDAARFDELKEAQAKQADTLTQLKAAHDDAVRNADLDAAISAAKAWSEQTSKLRSPSKAHLIGAGRSESGAYQEGDFIANIALAGSRDAEEQTEGKAGLRDNGFTYEKSWGKATLGTTDALGGWVIPNAVVDEFIKPASATNIYRQLMTTVDGVTGAAVDVPFRAATAARAVIAAFGATKENVDLAYNGYTVTMYTLARIYDIGNQFLRQSRGAAEQDVLQELASAFALGESYYIREGSGSSEPFGYTSALTNGPATFRTTGPSLSDSTLAGSIAACISMAAGDLAGRSVTPTAAVLAAAAYWQMLRQGSNEAGFWFSTVTNSPASIRPGTLISPFGIPVFADAGASQVGTAAVIDNLVVADWKKFKVYFGQNYRVDSSDVAGTRWDTNLTGFRGEEEMGFDARPTVYAGHAQMITDILP
jgi:HK97 family phage major capsid protein